MKIKLLILLVVMCLCLVSCDLGDLGGMLGSGSSSNDNGTESSITGMGSWNGEIGGTIPGGGVEEKPRTATFKAEKMRTVTFKAVKLRTQPIIQQMLQQVTVTIQRKVAYPVIIPSTRKKLRTTHLLALRSLKPLYTMQRLIF